MNLSYDTSADAAYQSYAASQQAKASQNAVAADSAFAATLNQINAPVAAETYPSMSLTPSNAAQGLPAQRKTATATTAASTTGSATQTKASQTASVQTEKTDDPKIARSWRMSEADQATDADKDATLSWGDLLDFVNPLQHIPVLSSLYREETGDTIKPGVQIAGDIGYGALTGSLIISAAVGIASAIYTEHSGTEPTIQVAQALFGDDTVGAPSAEAGKIDLAQAETQADSNAAALEAFAHDRQASVAALAQAPMALKGDQAAPEAMAQKNKQIASNAAVVSQALDATPAAVAQANQNKPLARGARGMRIGSSVHPSPSVGGMSAVASARGRVHPTGTLTVQQAQPATDSSASAASAPVAAQTSAAPPNKASAPVGASAAAPTTAVNAAASAETAPEDSAALVSMMQQQAQAKASGQPLPPALVQDMMLKALEKYQTSSALGSAPQASTVQ